MFGDLGRRGQLQNLPSGPTATGLGPIAPDDQFGGPIPDRAHFSGVILRLNDDGTTPTDNPFFTVGASIPGEVGINIQRIFAYGIRNSFGWRSIRSRAISGIRRTAKTRSTSSIGVGR